MGFFDFLESSYSPDVMKSHRNWCTRKALRQEKNISPESVLVVSHFLFAGQVLYLYFQAEIRNLYQPFILSVNVLSLLFTLGLFIISRRKMKTNGEVNSLATGKINKWIRLITFMFLGATYTLAPLVVASFSIEKESTFKFNLLDCLLTLSYGVCSYLISVGGMRVRSWFLMVITFFTLQICVQFFSFDYTDHWSPLLFTILLVVLIGLLILFLINIFTYEHEVYLRSERILKDIIFNMPSGFLLIDENMKPIFTNSKLLEILGIPIGSDIQVIMPVLNTLSFDAYKKVPEPYNRSWPSSSDSYRRRANHFFAEQPLKFVDILEPKERSSSQRYFYASIDNSKRSVPETNRDRGEKNYQRVGSFSSNDKILTNLEVDHKTENLINTESHYKVEISHFTDEAAFILISFIDITVAKSITESNLEKTFKNSLLDSFSHELKTPLNNTLIVLGCGIQDPFVKHDTKESYLVHPYNSLSLLSMMINEIIDFLKMESNQLEITTETFGLKNMLKEVTQLTQLRAKEKGIALKLEDSALISTLALKNDRERLMRMITNLVINCIKYTYKGFVLIKVVPPKLNKNYGREGFVTVEISDTRYLIQNGASEKDEEINLTLLDYDEFGALPDEKNELTLIINKAMVKYLLPDENCFLCQISRGGISYKLKIPCERGLAKIPSETSDRGESIEESPNKYMLSLKSVHSRQKSNEDVNLITNNEVIMNRSRILSTMSMNQMNQDKIEKRLEFRESSSNNLSDLILQIPNEHNPSTPKKSMVGGFSVSQFNEDDSVEQFETAKYSFNQKEGDKVIQRVSSVPGKEPKTLALIADDESFNLFSLQMILNSEEIECVKALNGKLALEAINDLKNTQKGVIDFALIDLKMPVMDGFECASNLKKLIESGQFPFFPIMACSANDSAEDREKAKASGFDAFISKPFSIRKLRDALSSIGWERRIFKKPGMI